MNTILVNLGTSLAVSVALVGFAIVAIGELVPGRRLPWSWRAAGMGGVVLTLLVANTELRLFPHAPTPGFFEAVIAGLLVAGAIVFGIGLKGRRVGDHSYCRCCGFDLTGRPETSDACAECGASLEKPRAIVVGVRHRRRLLMIGGAMFCVFGVTLGTLLARDMVRVGQIQLIQYKPTPWLLADLASSVATVQRDTIVELDRRLLAGTMTAANVKRYVLARSLPTALQMPGEPAAMVAWRTNQIDAETMSGIVTRDVTIAIDVPLTAGRLRVPFAMLAAGPLLSAQSDWAGWTAEVADRNDTINDLPVRVEGDATLITIQRRVPVAPWTPRIHQAVLTTAGPRWTSEEPLPVGRAKAQVKAKLIIRLNGAGLQPLTVEVPVTVGATLTISANLPGMSPAVSNLPLDAVVGLSNIGLGIGVPK